MYNLQLIEQSNKYPSPHGKWVNCKIVNGIVLPIGITYPLPCHGLSFESFPHLSDWKRAFVRSLRKFFVIRLGFEPKTHSLEGCCSIQLSYRTILSWTFRPSLRPHPLGVLRMAQPHKTSCTDMCPRNLRMQRYAFSPNLTNKFQNIFLGETIFVSKRVEDTRLP